jgi:predicted regulator of Ras-like GTPase activity (Roadblock/LC7/MglB family)
MMGLADAGKSSIQSVVFDGKKPEEVADYPATVNYKRSTKKLIGSTFNIFDCGGQETFLTRHLGKLSEFIFRDVLLFIWVIDVSNFDNVSKSKYYFDLAIKQLHKYSPEANVFCLFHKIDLLLPESREEVIKNIKKFFPTPETFETKYYATSIFQQSLFSAFSDILKKAIVKESAVGVSVTDIIKSFMQENKDSILGATLYSDEGLLVVEEGDMIDKLVFPANLWLANYNKLKKELKSKKVLKAVFEADDYLVVCQKVKEELHFVGIANKSSPLQFILMKVDQVVDKVNELLK